MKARRCSEEQFINKVKNIRIKKRIHETYDFARADVLDKIKAVNDQQCRPSHLDGFNPEVF